MKFTQAAVLALTAVAFMAGCAGATYSSAELSPSPGGASREPGMGTTWLSAARLHEMYGMSAFEALSLIPAYALRVNRSPAPHFVVVLNKHHLNGLEALKSIRAEDVKEIRLVTENQTVESGGALEVVVTTIR